MSLRWRQADEYYAISECGFYAVSKTGGIYSAWYRFGARPSSATGKMPLLLACNADPAVANRACGAHQRTFRPPTVIEPDAEAA